MENKKGSLDLMSKRSLVHFVEKVIRRTEESEQRWVNRSKNKWNMIAILEPRDDFVGWFCKYETFFCLAYVMGLMEKDSRSKRIASTKDDEKMIKTEA